jgi:tRNA dimethylallyltransferase
MMDMGVIHEVISFNKMRISKDKSINKAIGVVELKELIRNKISKEAVIEKISIKTRQYAKRQTTWARGHMSDWRKLKPQDLSKYLKKN